MDGLDNVIFQQNSLKSKVKQGSTFSSPNSPITPDGGKNGVLEWFKQVLGIGFKVNEFPIHLFPPRGAETFDIRKSVRLSSPDVTVTLIDWTIPNNKFVIWNGYSLFSDVPAGVTASWDLQVDGTPCFPFHGDSTDSFKKTLALSTDLSSLIYSLKELHGGQNIKVIGTVSSSAIACTIAARIVGWMVSKTESMA